MNKTKTNFALIVVTVYAATRALLTSHWVTLAACHICGPEFGFDGWIDEDFSIVNITAIKINGPTAYYGWWTIRTPKISTMSLDVARCHGQHDKKHVAINPSQRICVRRKWEIFMTTAAHWNIFRILMLLYMLMHRVETYYMATGNKRYYYLLFIWLRGGGSVHHTKTRRVVSACEWRNCSVEQMEGSLRLSLNAFIA